MRKLVLLMHDFSTGMDNYWPTAVSHPGTAKYE